MSVDRCADICRAVAALVTDGDEEALLQAVHTIGAAIHDFSVIRQQLYNRVGDLRNLPVNTRVEVTIKRRTGLLRKRELWISNYFYHARSGTIRPQFRAVHKGRYMPTPVDVLEYDSIRVLEYNIFDNETNEHDSVDRIISYDTVHNIRRDWQ